MRAKPPLVTCLEVVFHLLRVALYNPRGSRCIQTWPHNFLGTTTVISVKNTMEKNN